VGNVWYSTRAYAQRHREIRCWLSSNTIPTRI